MCAYNICIFKSYIPKLIYSEHLQSPEGFYYRFVAPCEGQQNGGWSSHENKLFMKRYEEWIEKGYKIGSAWGLFSCGIPHRVRIFINVTSVVLLLNRLNDHRLVISV